MANGGTTSATATTALQNNSAVVEINQAQIDSDISTINNETVADQSAERQIYINLGPAKDGEGYSKTDSNGNYVYEVTSEMGAQGTDGEVTFEAVVNKNGTAMRNGSVVLAAVHTHNKTSDPTKVNEPTTSSADANTASSFGVTNYAVDSYTGIQSTPTSGPAIHRVTADGTKTNNIGTTNSNNIGEDALKKFSGINN